jgi:hypothetical protein
MLIWLIFKIVEFKPSQQVMPENAAKTRKEINIKETR